VAGKVERSDQIKDGIEGVGDGLEARMGLGYGPGCGLAQRAEPLGPVGVSSAGWLGGEQIGKLCKGLEHVGEDRVRGFWVSRERESGAEVELGAKQELAAEGVGVEADAVVECGKVAEKRREEQARNAVDRQRGAKPAGEVEEWADGGMGRKRRCGSCCPGSRRGVGGDVV
jgi:hypothetical protein